MFPSHNNPSRSNQADGQTPEPAASAPPPKPSLRILDNIPGAREEDLLQGLGTGYGDEIHYPLAQIDTELVLEDLAQPGDGLESILPLHHSRIPAASPVQTISQSASSNAGRSFSLPTDGRSLINATQHHGTTQTDQSALPGVYEAAGLLPRHYEFSWEDSRLLFGGQLFDMVGGAEAPSSQPSPIPEVTSLTPPASPPRSRAQTCLSNDTQDLVAGAGGFADSDSVTSSCRGSNFTVDGELNPQVFRAIDWTVDLLFDDFVRSHAAQKSQNPSKISRSQDVSHASRDSHRVNKSTKRGERSSKRKGSGEDEDEDPRKGKATSRSARSQTSQYLACPFLKWRPRRYRQRCMRRLSTISHVKDHLKKEHYHPYCTNCYCTLPGDRRDHHICENVPAAPPVEPVSYGARKKIDLAIKKPNPVIEKWQDIYRAIFGTEPSCPSSPFLDYDAWETVERVREFISSDSSKAIIAKRGQSLRAQGIDPDKVELLIIDQLFARVASLLDSGNQEQSSGGVPVDETHNDNYLTAPACSNQARNPDDASVLSGTDSYGVQGFHDATVIPQMSPVLGLDEHFETMPRTDVDWKSLNAAAIGDLEPSGLEMDTSETHFDPSSFLVGAGFPTSNERFVQFHEEEEQLYGSGVQLDF
ncbi:hypothetical protein ACHAPT_001741 [Fusarium lateritium]